MARLCTGMIIWRRESVENVWKSKKITIESSLSLSRRGGGTGEEEMEKRQG